MGNCVSEAWDDVTGQSAAEDAARAQEDASFANIQLERDIYNQTREDFTPYRDLGTSSLSDLGQVAGQTPDYSYSSFQASPEAQLGGLEDFRTDPGYEFTREEGMRGMENKLSGIGMNNSGRALKELDRYNTGLADQQYGDWYNRQSGEYSNFVNRESGTQTNQYNQLMGLAGMGSNAAGQIGSAGQGMTNAISTENQAIADANAAASMQGYSGTSNLLNQGTQGAATLGSLAMLSDASAKEDIEDSDIGLDFVNKLRPVKYRYKGMDETSYGLIAQELKEAMGEKDGIHGYVDEDTQGIKYHELTAPLISAIHELSAKVERLENASR